MKLVIFAVALGSIFCAAASDVNEDAIYIPPTAGSIRLAKAFKYGGDTVLGAEFTGNMIIRGTVRYGRIADGEQDVSSDHEMQIELSEESARRLPRLPNCVENSCISSFVVVNADANLLTLFGSAATRQLKRRKIGSIETQATLQINRIEVSAECGVHYRVYIQRIKERAPIAKVLHGATLPPHC